jgi:hypothetical protein
MWLDRRCGRFSLDVDFLDGDGPVAAAMQIMGSCIILRAEHDLATGKINYTAFCPLFDEVPVGEMLPEYIFMLGGQGGIEVQRQ